MIFPRRTPEDIEDVLAAWNSDGHHNLLYQDAYVHELRDPQDGTVELILEDGRRVFVYPAEIEVEIL